MKFLHRLRGLFRKEKLDQQLGDELAFHLDKQTEQNLASGMSAQEARYAALRKFGGVEQVKEECRDMRRVNYIENFLQDVRYGLRQLRRNPGFTVVTVLTLALGIGANTGIFSLIDAIVLRPLPYPEADRLVALHEGNRKGDEYSLSWLDFVDWRNQSRSFSAMAAMQGGTTTLTGAGTAERLQTLKVSAAFFSILGVHPLLGRDFLDSDDRPGASPVAILSNAVWAQRFGADPHVIGRTIEMDGMAGTVIGVLRADFRFLYSADIYWPIGTIANAQGGRGNHPGIMAIGKLRPEVSMARARGEMSAIARRLEQAYPSSNDGIIPRLRPFAELVTAPAQRTLLTLWGAVGFLLLIACANVANLLLARAATREREMTIRVALGARRGRLITQLLTESGLLALCGAAAGCVIAIALLPLVLRLLPMELRQFVHVGINLRILGFSLLLTFLTTVLFGIIPAYRISSRQPDLALRTGLRASSAGFQKLSLRSFLVTVQIALALVLLAGAGLLIQSLVRLDRVNPGFRTDGVLAARLNLPRNRYPHIPQQTAFVDRMLERIDSIPGVLSASGSYCLPLDVHGCWSSVFVVEGRPVPRTEDLLSSNFNGIEPGYLKTMGIPLVRGRDFAEEDGPGSPMVLLVNEAFARKYFPHEDPLGKRIKQDFPEGKTPYATIVGVIGDARRDQLDQAAAPEAFEALRQMGPDYMNLVVRTALPNQLSAVPALRRALAELDPDVPLFDVRGMNYYVAEQTAGRRFPMLLLAAFAGIAMLLAIVGLYGLLSFLVTQRTKELGVRLALGAQRREITVMVMSQGLRLVAAGLIVGLGGAWALTRFLAALLFATQPNDAWTFVAVSCLLAVVAAMGCWLPARRAAAVDPMVALRYE
ncbi:MAG: ADOP family duplicated permease [Terriglobia bacterium]